MSVPAGNRYWPVPIARGVVAIAVTIAITFSADHSPALGFAMFGIFAVVTGLVLLLLGGRRLERGTERSFFLVQSIILIAGGVVALVSMRSGLPFFLALVSTVAVLTGAIEAYSGFRSRSRNLSIAKDWLFAGVLTLLFAVVVLLVPSNFSQSFTGPDEVKRVLTASVVVVGAFGAYSALLGVYLVIAGLSLKWGTQAAQADVAPATQGGN